MRPLVMAIFFGLALLFAGCSDADPVADLAQQPVSTPTETAIVPSLVPQPSPTPFVVPTIVATTAPTPTVTDDGDTDDGDADGDGDDADDPVATATAVAVPTSTPRPIPTAAPTATSAPRPAPTAVVVSPTPRPIRPTATAVPPTPVPTSAWVNPDCYVGPGAADEPAWWCGGKLCWPNSGQVGCPTTPPTTGYVEVGCTISDRRIAVNEIITLRAFQDPANVPIVFSFEHGDGTVDQTPESRAFYEAPGHYQVVMRWQHGRQTGRTFCGTVVVTGTANPTPTPTAAPAVTIGCTVSDRNVVVGELLTLQATQTPLNVPVAYVFEHGDGTLDPTAQSQAYYQAPGIYSVRLQWAHSGLNGAIDCGTVNVTPAVNLGAYIGLSGGQAEARAISQGLTLRIVRVDDQSYPGTTDYRLDRVNVEVDNGVVTKVYLG